MGMQKQLGASLMEVMVSLFVMAIGLLGILGLQFKSIQYTQAAGAYSQAIYLANDMLERIRANPSAVANYTQSIPTSKPSEDCVNDSSCSSDELVKRDLFVWNANLQRNLPTGAVGKIEKTGNNFTITITFDDSRSDKIDGVTGTGQAQKPNSKTYSILAGI